MDGRGEEHVGRRLWRGLWPDGRLGRPRTSHLRRRGRVADPLVRLALLLLNLFIGSRRGSGIDNLGHVGGFLAGGALGVLLARGSPGDRSASRGPVWRDEPRDEPRADSSSAALGAVAVRAATVAVWAALALSTRDFAAMTANLRARGLR